MQLFIVLFALLAVFSCRASATILTAKEAHDKMVECEKKCARVPNLLRCQQQCRLAAGPAHRIETLHKAHQAKKHIAKAEGVHKPKTMLLKGRRVVLEMRKKQ